MSEPNAEAKTYWARITYYAPDPKWGTQTASGKTATVGVTVAAHPDFKFGTEVEIPELKGIVGDGTFVVQDRGKHVTSKLAANKKGYVFDVYVGNKAAVKKHAISNEMWMKVIIK